MICEIHNVEMRHYEKNGKEWYAHQIDGVWCNAKPKGEPAAKQHTSYQSSQSTAKQEVDPKVWDAKDRQSMAQTAMKSASEIVAALIGASGNPITKVDAMTDVKTMANDFYQEIVKMKG